MVALVAIPKGSDYRGAIQRATHRILSEGHQEQFSQSERKHPRGAFPAVNVGVTHGKGTLKPINLNNHNHTPMVQRLLADEDIQRLAGFASGQSIDVSAIRKAYGVYSFICNVEPKGLFLLQKATR